MRRLTVILLVVLLALMPVGCQKTAEQGEKTPGETSGEESKVSSFEPADIKIGGLKGPTSMGMVQLMEKAEQGTAANNYSFTIAASADELAPKLIQGELDIAAVPANLAAILYKNTNKAVKLLAVNTLGVTYIVEKGNEIDALADLKGKTIYATGKGTVPEYTLRYLLAENGIDPDKDINIEWKSEPTEVVALLQEAETGAAMMPQPFVTVAQNQVEGLRIAVNLSQEWDKLDNGSAFITGVLVVRSEFAEKYPEQLAAFLDEYKESTEFVNENITEAAQLIEKINIVKAPIAEKAIPYCNITYIDGEEMKTAVQGYLEVLYNQNPKAVGGELPDDEFYYVR